MHSQHNQPTPATVPTIVLFGVAVVAVTVLGVIIAAQSVWPDMRVYEGTTALLASLTVLAGTGVIICVVAERVGRRLDALEAKLDGVDEEAADAARRINLRLLSSNN